MKTLPYFIVIGAFCISITPTSAQIVNALSTAPKNPTGEFTASKRFSEIPLDKARKKIVEHIEKKYVSFQNNSSLKSELLSQKQYTDYLGQFDRMYQRELQSIEESSLNTMLKMEKRSSLEKTFAVAYSGRCMMEKQEGVYVLSKDTDGQEIATLWVESVRDNPRYSMIDDYQQGFARIRKDGVYGFWDLCGNETIPPQYEQADRFNNGKALVKKFTWLFVNLKGEESEALADVEDAKAVKYGISIAKFTNQKMALIDNNFDISKETISEEFDEILPLTDDFLLVREGKKFGILRLDGKTIANVIYDKISLERKNEILLERNKKIIKKVISDDFKLVSTKK